MKTWHLLAFSLAAFIGEATAQDDFMEYASQGCLLALGDLSNPLVPGQLPDREVDVTIFESTWPNPNNVERGSFTNHFTGKPDGFIEYQFKDYEVRIEKPVSTASDIWYLTGLDIRDANVQLPCNLRVGNSIEKFRSALGEPLLMSTNQLVTYEWVKLVPLGDGGYLGAQGLISLTVENGVVTQISWGWQSD
jgi:hypothetical protein